MEYMWRPAGNTVESVFSFSLYVSCRDSIRVVWITEQALQPLSSLPSSSATSFKIKNISEHRKDSWL